MEDKSEVLLGISGQYFGGDGEWFGGAFGDGDKESWESLEVW